uniref:Uncharacterized protein n=1 Tax=Timema bartmani TaxID=61472 RepID=A0A7R9ETF1_9NEOP|nr:unnamed protein product [Timema bartmani]
MFKIIVNMVIDIKNNCCVLGDISKDIIINSFTWHFISIIFTLIREDGEIEVRISVGNKKRTFDKKNFLLKIYNFNTKN